ncbi:hypothetical protein MSPP1_001036 [Malassezia sp. CBS 17886]|nr:hypothetical protein MSPP1_001036 [Malassezia sp. CBS 17886]
MAANVRVVARFRPASVPESGVRDGDDSVVVALDGAQTVQLQRAGGGADATGPFAFDRVFPMDSRQADVFEYGIKETVEDVLQGYNGTIFAYGQTGSGKTYTMMGSDINDVSARGIIPRITDQIFHSILASAASLEYLVKVSYMEIYMERIRDLLAPERDNLSIHEDRGKGVYVKGLSEYYVGGADEVLKIIDRGSHTRAVSSTRMNTESSRSHTIFCYTIQQRNTESGTVKSGNLYLVDLAGSEKVNKTGASGRTLEEAKKINKSLSALGMVINALTDGKASHVPYRDSKLTRILQESLGGNSRTTLIINASPCAYNADETLSTLRFGVRAKSIQNNARVNAELSPAELRRLLRTASAQSHMFQRQAAALEREVVQWRAGASVARDDWVPLGADSARSGGFLAPGDPPSGDSVRAAGSTAPDTSVPPPAYTCRALHEQVAAAREQEASLAQQLRARDDGITALQLRVDELAFQRAECESQLNALRAQNTALERTARNARADSAPSAPEARITEMLAALGSTPRATSDTLALVARMEAATRGHAGAALSTDEVQRLHESVVQDHILLAEQGEALHRAETEARVVAQQKQALGATSALDAGAELAHAEHLLALRTEETQSLSDSLSDLRASHEEQRNALQLVTTSAQGGGADDAAVQRLVAASTQMEKARDLVTLRLREYERMKQQLMHGLRERSEKVVEMEMALEDVQEQFCIVMKSIEMRTQQKRMEALERHLEQLGAVHQRLIEQNASLKRDVAVADKRVSSRNERIRELETSLYARDDAPEPWAPDELSSSAGGSGAASPAAPPSSIWGDRAGAMPFGRIAKPLRGGGAPGTVLPVQGTTATTGISPPKPRGNWFFAAK